jgi:hypothetical protein
VPYSALQLGRAHRYQADMPHLPVEDRARHEHAAMQSFGQNPTGYVAERGLRGLLPMGATTALATAVAAPRFARKFQYQAADALHNQATGSWLRLAGILEPDAIKGELEKQVARRRFTQKGVDFIEKEVRPLAESQMQAAEKQLGRVPVDPSTLSRSVDKLPTPQRKAARKELRSLILGSQKARYYKTLGEKVFGRLHKHKLPLIAGASILGGLIGAGAGAARLSKAESKTPDDYRREIAAAETEQAINYQKPRSTQIADVAWQALAE